MHKVIHASVVTALGLALLGGGSARAMPDCWPNGRAGGYRTTCNHNGVCEYTQWVCIVAAETHASCPSDCQCSPIPGDTCTQCVLKARPDVYSFLVGSWGYPTTCTAENSGAMMTAWCGYLDPVACNTLMRTTCASACGTSLCGTEYTQCTFEYRKDLLPYFMSNGYDMSCANRDALRLLWNSWASPEELRDVKRVCAPHY